MLLTCDRQGLIGRQMFAIDGVKLPSNASKERSGAHQELRHRADRPDKAARKMIELHRSRDAGGEDSGGGTDRQRRIEALQREAQATREFLAGNRPRRNAKGQELKSNVTDNDSAKMATSKGVIQGYAAQAAVDASHQVIVTADVVGSGSEQALLDRQIPVMVADGLMRKRDERLAAQAHHKAKPDARKATRRERGIYEQS